MCSGWVERRRECAIGAKFFQSDEHPQKLDKVYIKHRDPHGMCLDSVMFYHRNLEESKGSYSKIGKLRAMDSNTKQLNQENRSEF
jgi:hypothetical protein